VISLALQLEIGTLPAVARSIKPLTALPPLTGAVVKKTDLEEFGREEEEDMAQEAVGPSSTTNTAANFIQTIDFASIPIMTAPSIDDFSSVPLVGAGEVASAPNMTSRAATRSGASPRGDDGESRPQSVPANGNKDDEVVEKLEVNFNGSGASNS